MSVNSDYKDFQNGRNSAEKGDNHSQSITSPPLIHPKKIETWDVKTSTTMSYPSTVHIPACDLSLAGILVNCIIAMVIFHLVQHKDQK